MALDVSGLVPRRWLGKTGYRVEDVQKLLDSVHKEQEHLERMEKRLEELEKENETLTAQDADNRLRLEQMNRELGAAREQEQDLRRQIADQQDMLERARRREEFLNDSLERQKKEIADFEKFAESEPVTKAYDKAEKILADARAERERLLQDYDQQRARVAAAARSAYYNALQFKMSLAQRFGEMEKNLDESIDVLRVLEASAVTDVQNLNAPEPDVELEPAKDSQTR